MDPNANPNGKEDAGLSGTNQIAVIIGIAIGLVLTVAIVAFAVVQCKGRGNASPTTTRTNSSMASQPAYDTVQAGGGVATANNK